MKEVENNSGAKQKLQMQKKKEKTVKRHFDTDLIFVKALLP